jgi:hypothetical protein
MVRRLFDLDQRLAAAYRAAASAEEPDTAEEARRLLRFGRSLTERGAAVPLDLDALRSADLSPPAGSAEPPFASAPEAASIRADLPLTTGLGPWADAIGLEALNIMARAPAPPEREAAVGAVDLLPALRRRAALRAYFRPEALLRELGDDAAAAQAGSRFLDHCERDPATGLYFLRTDIRMAELKDLVADASLAAALADVPPPAADDTLGTIYRAILEGRPLPTDGMNEEQLRCLERAAEWTRDVLPGAPDVRAVRAVRARRAFQSELEPLLARGFFGRGDELTRLREFVRRPPGATGLEVTVVTGSGGTGKSTLLAQLLRDLRAGEAAPMVGWLDFDRPGLDPDIPHLLAFELSRQVGIQFPDIAELLHDLRERLRTEGLATEGIRQALEAAFERGQKAMDEMNHTLAVLLGSLGVRAGSLVLILDTFEEVTRRGHDAVRSVFGWLGNLRQALGAINLRVIVSGRLYDQQLKWLGQPGARLEIIDLPPLDRHAAIALLLRNAVPQPLASTIADLVPNQPLPLLLVAQLQETDPDFDLKAFARDVQSLPERRRIEAFSSLVYWRNLARLRDPVVRVLAHPGLVLRRVTPAAVTEVLLPALTAFIEMFEKTVLQVYDALRDSGLVVEAGGLAPGTGDAQGGRRVALAIASLARLSESALAQARAYPPAKPHFARLDALVGSAPGRLWKEYQATRDDAAALRELEGDRLERAYAALVSYAWLVENRPNGAWHRPDLRRVILPHMLANRPGVALAIHHGAIRHYEGRPDPDDAAEAAYHRLMLAETPEACDALDRALIRSAAGSIRRDADDLPNAARVFFHYLDGGDVLPENVSLLPARERAEAFNAVGDKLVREGRYDDVAPMLAARPPHALLRAWEAQARFALVDWPALAAEPMTMLDPSASPAQRHFWMHYKAFALFLSGDLEQAGLGFAEAARFAERMITQQTDRFLLARSVLYGLVVAHAREATPDELSIQAERAPLGPDLSQGRPQQGDLGVGLETARLALLLSERAIAQSDELVVFEFPLDLLSFEPELLGLIETEGLAATQGAAADLRKRAERTKALLDYAVEDSRTMREMLRRVDAIRREEASLIGSVITLTWSRHNRRTLYPLLRGPDPEFRDPLRTALSRAFPSRADHEELAALVDGLYPAGLEDLQPSAFAAAMEADSRTTLVTLVEFVDRARRMREVAHAALERRPGCAELARFVDGYERWCRAFDHAAGVRTPAPM